MKKNYLHKDFHEKKTTFYKQRLFDETRCLKIGFFFVVLVSFIWEICLGKVITPDELKDDGDSSNAVIIFFYVASLLIYFITTLKIFERLSNKTVFQVRYVLLLLVVLCYSAASGTSLYYTLGDAVDSNNTEKWFYFSMRVRNETLVILVFDTIIPIWYIRALFPLVRWIVTVYVYFQNDMKHGGIVWASFISYMVIIITIWGLKAYGEWKTFVKRVNAEDWDGVHKDILDNLPNAVAVIDTKGTTAKYDVVYSNKSFQALCNNNIDDLAKSFSKIKKLKPSRQQQQTATTLNTKATTRRTLIDEAEEDEEDHSIENKNPSLPDSHLEVGASDFHKLLENIVVPQSKNSQLRDNYRIYHANYTPSTTDSSTSTFSYEIKVGPLAEYDKVILILSDTTERDLAVSLETANNYKDKLLATVSHDLRAPINGSLTFLENSIHHKDLNPSIKENFLIPAQRSLKFLLYLVNDILDFSQINARKIRLSFETLSLVETVKNCHQLLEMQAKSKGIGFPLVLDKNLPKLFTTDHHRLSQIIINLLTNAIKFTSKGQVTLSVTLKENNRIEVKVKDTGLGIRLQDQEKLFKEFTRINHERKDINSRGIGLGLVIANNLAKRLGPATRKTGIDVFSIYGEGSTFRFYIEEKGIGDSNPKTIIKNQPPPKNPVNRTKIQRVTSIEKEENFANFKIDERDFLNTKTSPRSPYDSSLSIKRSKFTLTPLTNNTIIAPLFLNSDRNSERKIQEKILIVDDNPINILALESIFKPLGIGTEKAFHGQEAIDKILQSEHANTETKRDSHNTRKDSISLRSEIGSVYKLIFMDYEMPVLDGIEATKVLVKMMKKHEIRDIPIIGCTGHNETEKVEEGLACGMTDVICKPIQRQTLFELVEKYLH